MANIKSAKKRVLVSQKKAAKNKAVRSGVKTAIKKVDAAIAAQGKAAAEGGQGRRLPGLQAILGGVREQQ